MPEQQEFHTIDEVAKILRISHDTVYRMIKAGELEAVRVSHRWRVRKESVDKYRKKS